MSHRFFGVFLLILALTSAFALMVYGYEYYVASARERAFMPELSCRNSGRRKQ